MKGKRIARLAALLLLLAAGAAAEGKTAARTAAVLDSPGGGAVGRVYAGAELPAEPAGAYCLLRLAGLTGYVEADALGAAAQDGTRAAQVFSPYGTPTVVLRSLPSDSYGAQGILRAGDTVRVLGEFGAFRLVSAGGALGFLAEGELR